MKKCISREQFHRLRLKDFAPENDVSRVHFHEYLGKLWVGDVIGFTEWLRLYSSPWRTQSISVSFPEVDETFVDRLQGALGFEVGPGMKLSDLMDQRGKPFSTETFVEGRCTYIYKAGPLAEFELSYTIPHEGCVTYFTMHLTSAVGE